MIKGLLSARWFQPAKVEIANNPVTTTIIAASSGFAAASSDPAQTVAEAERLVARNVDFWRDAVAQTTASMNEVVGGAIQLYAGTATEIQADLQQEMIRNAASLELIGTFVMMYAAIIAVNVVRSMYGLMYLDGDSFATALGKVAGTFKFWELR